MGCVSSVPGGAVGQKATGKVSPGVIFSFTEALSEVEAEVDKLATELTIKAAGGAGAYAIVRQARTIKTGELVAVKTLSLQSNTKDSMKRARRRSETSVSNFSESEESIRAGIGYARHASVGGDGTVSPVPAARGGGGSTFSTSPPSKVASGVTAKDLQRTRSTQHELTLICREIDTLASLRHDCIVELKEYFVCSSGSRIHIVLELLPGGDLKDNLSWGERDFFSEAESRIIAKRVLAGLEYLHSRKKLRSQERGNLNSVKIVDFGFAREIGRQSMGIRNGSSSNDEEREPSSTPVSPAGTHTNLRSLCGTPHFIAPEVIGVKQSSGGLIKTAASDGYDSAADMWSFGVVLFQMLSGTVPFDAPDQAGLFEQISNGVVDMDGEEWEGVSEEAKTFIRRLLVVHPKKRLTATQALLHDPWLNASKRVLKRSSQSSGSGSQGSKGSPPAGCEGIRLASAQSAIVW